jgi:hypothetical protein
MAGEPGMERGVVGYSYPDSEQFAEWSNVCDRGGVYWEEKNGQTLFHFLSLSLRSTTLDQSRLNGGVCLCAVVVVCLT